MVARTIVSRLTMAIGAGWLLVGATPPAAADERGISGFVHIEGNASFFTDEKDAGVAKVTFGYAGRGGVRFGQWDAFLHVGHSMWYEFGVTGSVNAGVLNVALGVEYRYLDDRLRSSLALGTSTLLFDAMFDDAGSTGMYADIRPLGLRWNVSGPVTIGIDPLTFALMAPVLGRDRRIVLLSYRCLLVLEFGI